MTWHLSQRASLLAIIGPWINFVWPILSLLYTTCRWGWTLITQLPMSSLVYRSLFLLYIYGDNNFWCSVSILSGSCLGPPISSLIPTDTIKINMQTSSFLQYLASTAVYKQRFQPKNQNIMDIQREPFSSTESEQILCNYLHHLKVEVISGSPTVLRVEGYL